MVRILGIDLLPEKRVKYALTSIYGIGVARAEEILEKSNLIDLNQKVLKVKDLSDSDISTIRNILETDYKLEGELRRFKFLSIKRLMENGSIRGRRLRAGLPVRGQRTKTNARTRKQSKNPLMKKKN